VTLVLEEYKKHPILEDSSDDIITE